MSDDFRIREFADGDSITAITALLHAAYGSLAASGFRYLASHQDEATTLRRLRSGIPFVAECGAEIIGTVTVYPPSASSSCEWYRTVHHFGQFAVRPELQGRGFGSRLYEHVEAFTRSLGVDELALDTAEGAQHLRRWYERLGFRLIQFISWNETNYRSVILSKSLGKSATAHDFQP
ncbi:MAG TPA: GNAT family N-acetyltransferase [Candidatus Sulfotelmatobacter sp.]|nr:GNAT family N-acetyltransferase [Candidatus Sulfotelmatobacter sp.]